MINHNIVETENFLISYSVVDNNYFMHCEVYNWKPSVYKDLRAVWPHVLGSLRRKGVDYIFTYIPPDDKTMKFNEMFGFQYANKNLIGGNVMMYRGTG